MKKINDNGEDVAWIYECNLCERKCWMVVSKKGEPSDCPYGEVNYCWEELD